MCACVCVRVWCACVHTRPCLCVVNGCGWQISECRPLLEETESERLIPAELIQKDALNAVEQALGTACCCHALACWLGPWSGGDGACAAERHRLHR